MATFKRLVAFQLDPETAVQPRWLWHGLVAAGKVTLFTSLWKSGKTTLVAHYLARRRTGGEFLGRSVAAGGTLVVSEEPDDLWPWRRQRFGLGSELGVLTRPFTGRPTMAEFRELADQIVELKRERGTDLVVFDSLACFLPGNTENNAGVMTDALAPFLRLANAGLAVWLLHHPSKGEPALGQAARGSGALMAAVDILLEMRHPGGDPFTRRRKLFGWSRYEDTPRQLVIELSADGLQYEWRTENADDGPEPLAKVRSVLESASGPLTRAEIEANWPPDTPRPHEGTLWRWLDRAVDLGLVERVGKGTKTEPYRYGVGG